MSKSDKSEAKVYGTDIGDPPGYSEEGGDPMDCTDYQPPPRNFNSASDESDDEHRACPEFFQKFFDSDLRDECLYVRCGSSEKKHSESSESHLQHPNLLVVRTTLNGNVMNDKNLESNKKQINEDLDSINKHVMTNKYANVVFHSDFASILRESDSCKTKFYILNRIHELDMKLHNFEHPKYGLFADELSEFSPSPDSPSGGPSFGDGNNVDDADGDDEIYAMHVAMEDEVESEKKISEEIPVEARGQHQSSSSSSRGGSRHESHHHKRGARGGRSHRHQHGGGRRRRGGNNRSRRNIRHRNIYYDQYRLPCYSEVKWARVISKLHEPTKGIKELQDQIGGGLHRYPIPVLEHYVRTKLISGDLWNWFFKELIPFIKSLVAELPNEFPGNVISMLNPKSNREGSTDTVELTRRQISCLLACGFFCLFRTQGTDTPTFNFNGVYQTPGDRLKSHIGKIGCFLTYFETIRHRSREEMAGTVKFIRNRISSTMADDVLWKKEQMKSDSKKLSNFWVRDSGNIEEDGKEMLQVDFAARHIGGGVLGRGCVQEEIRFCICPELIVSRLICPVMDHTESIIMIGAEQFSKYSGYARTFECAGQFKDNTPRDAEGVIKTVVVAIDAERYNRRNSRNTQQFQHRHVSREIVKAYAGFVISNGALGGKYDAIATGNWGCGAFNGDIALKSMIQWIVASFCERDIHYFTFGDKRCKDLLKVVKALRKRNVKVGELYRDICLFGSKIDTFKSHVTLFDFLLVKYDRKESRKLSDLKKSTGILSNISEFTNKIICR